MLNRGPAKWREWRLGNQVLPLYLPDPKAPPLPEHIKPLPQVSHMTIAAMKAKNSLPVLTEAIDNLIKEPDSPTGRVHEERFRQVLKEIAAATLTADELEAIFPPPVILAGSKPGSRKPSKGSRKPSKEGS